MRPPEEETEEVVEPPKELFGRCPICHAIISLDCTINVKCDSCD